jgi:hypothetical protein
MDRRRPRGRRTVGGDDAGDWAGAAADLQDPRTGREGNLGEVGIEHRPQRGLRSAPFENLDPIIELLVREGCDLVEGIRHRMHPLESGLSQIVGVLDESIASLPASVQGYRVTHTARFAMRNQVASVLQHADQRPL